jgi:drug/metabolite transporter (DMT)-like permease
MPKGVAKYLLVFGALISWALSFPSMKVVLDEVDPLTLGALRFIIPIPIIFFFYHLDRKKQLEASNEIVGSMKSRIIYFWTGGGEEPAESSRMAVMLVAFGLFNIAFPNILQNYGMQTTESGIASIIQGSGPIFAILLAVLFLHERLNNVQIFGVCMATVGSILLVTEGEAGLGGEMWGKFLILLSAVSYAISTILGKKLLETWQAMELTFKGFIIGGTSLALSAILLEDTGKIFSIETVFWGHILFLALLPSCFAYIVWYRAMEVLPVSKLIITIFLIPVMAVIFSVLLLQEEISLNTVITGGMVIIGVIIAERKMEVGQLATEQS